MLTLDGSCGETAVPDLGNIETLPQNTPKDTLITLSRCPHNAAKTEHKKSRFARGAFFLRFLQQSAVFLGHDKCEVFLRGEALPQTFVHPDDISALYTFIENVAAQSKVSASSNALHLECRFQNGTGQWRQILCRQFAAPPASDLVGAEVNAENVVEKDNGRVFVYVCDITERRSQEERLRLLESIVTNANDVILITEAEPIDLPSGGPRVVYINEAFTRMTGYEPHEILGKTPRVLQGPGTNQETRRFIREKLKAWEGFRAELLNYKKDGTPFWVEISVQPVCNEVGWYTHWIAVQRETTERRELEMEREKLLTAALERAEKEKQLAEALDRADRDPLTNLFNHRAFHERLASEAPFAVARASTPLFVVLLDLDNFKFFNDAYGHLTGDTVLRRLSRALQGACRPTDILARMGGDEFAIVGTGRTVREATLFVERLKSCVGDIGYCPPGYDMAIPLSVSCGIAFFGDDSSSVVPLEVLKLADERLLRDKVGDQDYHIERLRDHLKATVDGFAMLDALVTAVDNKDRYTRHHSEDVLLHSVAIAQAIGFSQREIDELQVAALLHDVGKIGVPDRILRMPGRLSDEEYDAIKQHAAMGAVLVGAVSGLRHVVDTVHFHHEHWDGSGYPKGLQGEAIPLPARIMAVADAYSAMTANRPYRKGMTPMEAQQVLKRGGGKQWDARCVQAFLNLQNGIN